MHAPELRADRTHTSLGVSATRTLGRTSPSNAGTAYASGQRIHDYKLAAESRLQVRLEHRSKR
jgi:hypothetical protein